MAPRTFQSLGACLAAGAALLGAACGGSDTGETTPAVRSGEPGESRPSTSSAAEEPGMTATPGQAGGPDLLPGMPKPVSATNVYAAAGADMLSSTVRNHRALVYVPNSNSDDVHVIDQQTFEVIDHFPGGAEPQHVVPSYDLRTLYVAADEVPGGSLTPIDPVTGRPGKPIPVQDPYNMYYTPDGTYAIVVAEAYRRLDFYDPRTWELRHRLPTPDCAGIDHMDFTADGRLLLASCEFAGRLVVIDVASRTLVRTLDLTHVPDGMPQDVKLSPDGRTFYVADMVAGGVYTVDGAATRVTGFLPTGKGAHGLYVDRPARRMFITNRDEGSISIFDFAAGALTDTWHLPDGSPDMGGVSADGAVLWLSGRYDREVYALSTEDGRILARIPVGDGPHGLCVWPQPGRYSLGHTGILR